MKKSVCWVIIAGSMLLAGGLANAKMINPSVVSQGYHIALADDSDTSSMDNDSTVNSDDSASDSTSVSDDSASTSTSDDDSSADSSYDDE